MSNSSKMPPASSAPTQDSAAAEPHFLGTRIRGLRKRRGMTLAELAQMSELTAGYISQLERNLAYPSIPALFNIARSLGVTIQWFFASEGNTAPEDNGVVVRKNTRMSVHYEDGIVDQLLTPQPNRQLEMLHSKLPDFGSDSVAGSGQFIQEEQPAIVLAAVARLDQAALATRAR